MITRPFRFPRLLKCCRSTTRGYRRNARDQGGFKFLKSVDVTASSLVSVILFKNPHYLFSFFNFHHFPSTFSLSPFSTICLRSQFAPAMSRTGRSSIRSVLTAKDLEAFVEAYNIPERFPQLCKYLMSQQSVLLTESSFILWHSLPTVFVTLCRFTRVVHFELSCVVVSGEPSIPLFYMFYKLISDGDWFTFAKRKDSVSLPCYSFMPTFTYPKEWKSRFIFVSAAMMSESPPL
ncbi:hypothetical protein Hanom_Chr09g00822051 [Helianthus anomalus]